MTPIFSRSWLMKTRQVLGATRGRELAKRLRHQTGLKTHVAIAHFAFYFGLGNECCDGIDHDQVDACDTTSA